jgi:hypothetical protein
MNFAYKHLDAKLRIAGLSLGQWAMVAAVGAAAIVYGFYLSPFGVYVTLFSAVYLAALPIGATAMAALNEIDVGLLVRSAIRWRRMEGRYVPGPGPARGYAIRQDSTAPAIEESSEPEELDLEALWDS